jgi:GTP1/Obg family GTP-binding protein
MLKTNDVVICTDSSGGIVGWLDVGKEYIVEWVSGADIKLTGYVYTTKQWRFKLKGGC